jgi:hypothetical protein
LKTTTRASATRAASVGVLSYECGSAAGSVISDSTSTRSPPTAVAMLPYTFVEVTTLTGASPAGAAGCSPLLPEAHPASVRTASAATAAPDLRRAMVVLPEARVHLITVVDSL